MTYFFNGGREEPFEGEERKMIPSPKDVATYDQKPEMSAAAVADAVVAARSRADKFDFMLVNFANPDMVGHTGVLDAARSTRSRPSTTASGASPTRRSRKGGALLITADHGNCELMKDPATGAAAHRAHAQPGAAPLRERRATRRRRSAAADASATSRRRCSSCSASPSPPP